ncbi:MAG: tripartite tricarboxylate transporter permease [Desulfitobacterium hafniense]|nr:tripartite tricarboxylate transporter permease [Desulfitobacterium hafniense]
MDVIQQLMMGFATAATPENLLYALAGAFIGTIVGVLPGIGPLGSMAILLSFTLNMDATTAMIFFAGIYYGSMYGGSTTSILLNIPGEAASVVTCLDGYEMAKKGRAGAALTISALGSFVAGTLSIIGLMFAAASLADTALKFGPPEFFAIGLVGLLILVRLSGGSLSKNMVMVLLGLAVSTIGTDKLMGLERFTFGISDLGQGVEFLPVAMGLFGIAEVMLTADEKEESGEAIKIRMRDLLPTGRELKRSAGPIFRGSILGFLIGLLPGPSPVISTFVSYLTEKKLSKNPDEFGKGAVEGVAGPEAANNASVGGAYVPLMALGVPFTPAMAVVVGALMLHGITPGPTLIAERPELFWGVIASMYIGNLMLLVLNLPLVQVFVKITTIPKQILLPLIVLLCLVGVYSVNSSYVDLFVLAIFGVIGYLLRGVGYEPAPLVLALVIGPMMETALRQALMTSEGKIGDLIFRPISGTLYALAILAFIIPPVIKRIRGNKNQNSGTSV